jgi:hypothetical protein
MTVEAENAPHQLAAKTVHNRHHYNQRGDAKADPSERKSGNDGNEPFLPPGTQIAPGHQPFKG